MLFFTLHLGCALLDSSGLPSRDEASPLHHPAVHVPRRTVTIGSNDSEARPDESPVHSVEVGPFWMDATEVTNQAFAAFVEATGYTTTAEQPIDWDALKAQLPPGTPKPPKPSCCPDQWSSPPHPKAPPSPPSPIGGGWVPGRVGVTRKAQRVPLRTA